MSEPSLDITLLVMLTGAVLWIALYVIFAIGVTHQANPAVSRRWKAAVVHWHPSRYADDLHII